MINAVAGGGTLLTFPTLLAFGTSPVMANATSTLALVIGTSGGMFGNRQYISATRMFPRRRFTRTSCRSQAWECAARWMEFDLSFKLFGSIASVEAGDTGWNSLDSY